MTSEPHGEGGVALRLSWSDRDHHGLLTAGALAGAFAAAAMGLWGLPPVDLHGPLHKVGIMDPLCGGTRAAWFTVQGRLGEAWRYNPLGIAAVVAAVLVTVRALAGAVAGRWLTLSVRWSPRVRTTTTLVLVLLLTVLEIRQQGRADLLMEGTLTL